MSVNQHTGPAGAAQAAAEPAAAEPGVARLREVRGQHEAIVRWLRILTLPMLATFVVAAWLADPGPALAGRGLVVSVAAAVFVVAVFGRNQTVGDLYGVAHLGFVSALLVSSLLLVWVQPQGPGPECVLLGVLCVARLLPPAAGVPVLLVGFIGLEVIAWITGLGGLAVLAAFAAFYGMLYLAFRLGEANKQAERLLAQLRRSQEAQARAAGLAERQRLAREMHDVLAHSLSGLMLQLEGARMLSEGPPGDPRLPVVINRAHQLCRTGLDEARRAIGMLRDDDLPGPERLAGLAVQFEQDRGVPCRLTVSGEPCPLQPQARLALYRVAQEALTNIGRHARPERVELRLRYAPSGVRLTVEDHASHVAPPAPDGQQAGAGAGYGLTGMRERAELIGGTLDAGPTPQGFRVELDVPACPAATEPAGAAQR